MTRTDFYLLKHDSHYDQLHFCCRLVEKAIETHDLIHIQTGDETLTSNLDELLWTFKEEAFIPHETLGGANGGQPSTTSSPVLISTCGQLPILANSDLPLFIALSHTLPNKIHDYKRMCILTINQREALEQSRRLYRQLQSQGLDLNVIDLRKQ